MAGGDQGRLHGTGQRRLRVRNVGPLAIVRDGGPKRDLAQGIYPDRPSAGIHAVQRVPARPLRLSILRRARFDRAPDFRPRYPAFARRAHDLDQRRHGVLAVQSAQGQQDAGALPDASATSTVRANQLPVAGQRPGLPAELPARKLDGFPLLGCRAGRETRAVRSTRSPAATPP